MFIFLVILFLAALGGIGFLVYQERKKARASAEQAGDDDPDATAPGLRRPPAPGFGHRAQPIAQPEPEPVSAPTGREPVPGFDTPLDDAVAIARREPHREPVVAPFEPLSAEPLPPEPLPAEPLPTEIATEEPVPRIGVTADSSSDPDPEPVSLLPVSVEALSTVPIPPEPTPKLRARKPAVGDGEAAPKPIRKPRVKKEA